MPLYMGITGDLSHAEYKVAAWGTYRRISEKLKINDRD
ncbi:hypothetical protein MC7420_166 [Coleofasciculus chthonoplastes PCC 7420]|uniref:Uncharacterized protein n=2 Tax=Coleofasciculus chthonoplastes TaxID=64178 RepID=B4W5F2_9CYAN|nr:hypothetical protein MC7420_166 [Coleofasciculus chthonoplastes PCC 7420]